MILYKYIFKDIFKVQLVTFLVLMSIFLCQSIIKFLGQASSGSVPVGIVTELVFYSMPSIGFILIPLTLYVGIIVALSRMSSDSEMVVMRAGGISGFTFQKICFILAIISAGATALNCLYFMPKSNYEKNALTEKAQSDPQYFPIESGKFTNYGNYTFYIQEVEGDKAEKKLGQIFVIRTITKININNPNEFLFLSSNSGHMHKDASGVQWVTLDKGKLYKSDGISAKLTSVAFDTLSIPVKQDDEESSMDDSLQSTSTAELIASDSYKAKIELQWRISPILACFIFAIMAVPLSMINPRQGRFARLGPAIILFVCYYLGLLSIRNLLNSEKFPLFPGMYIVPVVFLLFILIPLNMDKSLFALFKENRKIKKKA